MTFLLSIVGSILLLDQVSKLLVLQNFPIQAVKEIIPGYFNLTHVRNTGAAFSFLAGGNSFWRQALFVGMTVLVLGIILFAYGKVSREDSWTRTAYALICGGAVGNLVDRLRFGEVVDFLDFYAGTYHWPVFNVADCAISAGAVMLFISLVRGK